MVSSEPGYQIKPAPKGAPKALAFEVEDPDGKTYNAYASPHPAVTATIVLLDRVRKAYLLTRRNRPPFQDELVFPGGFVDAGEETAEEAAVRELYEETGLQISPDELHLIDVRSDPGRDPRDHIIDIGFYAECDCACARPGDGVSEIKWITSDDLHHMQLGFDHSIFWHNVCAWMRKGVPQAAKPVMLQC